MSVINLTQLCEEKGWDILYSFTYTFSLVPQARDVLANQFLETDCTHLLFVDADTSFNPYDVISMLEEDKDVIAGICPKKTLYWERLPEKRPLYPEIEVLDYVFMPLDRQYMSFTNLEPFECAGAGTGYMLIKRRVFEELEVPAYRNDNKEALQMTSTTLKNFFFLQIDSESNALMGEDYAFCALWRRQGGKVYIAPYARAAHHGSYTFGFKTVGPSVKSLPPV